MQNNCYYRQGQLEIIHLQNRPLEYKAHTHLTVYTIGLVLQGQALLQTGGKRYTIPAGSFFTVSPCQLHSLSLPNRYELLSLCLEKSWVAACRPGQLFAQLCRLLPVFSSKIDYAKLAQAVALVCQPETGPPAEAAVFSTALAFYHTPETTIRLEDLAKKVSYSLYHYIKLFKKSLGLPPHKFQTQSRIRKAQRRIEQGHNLTAIAMELGFYDQSHFTKCFKQQVGFTPREYSRLVKRPE